ncbi:MAG: glycosyltransferase family 4 protein [Ardenticatenaceae bacterium]|nr:glycosyltransferase family 4 protein [Ardenticatenaceae bacterium]MCB8946815.1 glycosyltransferase family 4 protein [Ardenticatenaceae bacterium]
MRIGIDVTAALTQGGGIGRYTRELVQALAAVDAQNSYQLFSAKPPATLPVPEPLPQTKNFVHKPAPLDERWLYRLWYRLRLPLPVQWVTGQIDLFHSPDFVLPPVNGRIPTLLTVHDLSFVHYPHVFPERLVTYLNQVVPWSIGRATHILADSDATRQDLLNIWQVPPEKVTVLYSGVHERFEPVEDGALITAVRHKYHLQDWPYILSVGTLQPRKNYQMLIRAFALLADKVPHHLVISGGKGWLYDEMLAEVERQGLTGRVHFIGFVDDADLPTLYSEADLFVFPSLYEGFGLPLLEAMGCGTAVLTSNSSSLPEVAGTAARQLPPTDEAAWTENMLALLTDIELRDKLVLAGLTQAKQFSWQTAAQQLLKIYQQFGLH